MSVGQLARSFQAKAPVLCLQQHPDLFAVSMTRIPLIVSIGSILAGRAWATSRVYRRAAALDSHRINHRRWFCAASIATHIWSRRDRAIRIFNFPPKAAHLSAPRNSFSFAAAFQDVQNTGTISKTFGSIAPEHFRTSVSIVLGSQTHWNTSHARNCTGSELAKESPALQSRHHI